MAMSVTVGWTRIRPSWKTATGKPASAPARRSRRWPSAEPGSWNAAGIELRSSTSRSAWVSADHRSPTTWTAAKPACRRSRPQVEQLADAAEERLIRVGRRCNTSLSNWPRTDARTRSLLASGSPPQASAQSTSKPLLASGAAMSASARTSAPGASDEATAGNDQGRFTSSGRELRQLCQAVGTSGASEDLVVAAEAALEHGLYLGEPSRIREHHEEHGHRLTGTRCGLGCRGSSSMRQPYQRAAAGPAPSGVQGIRQ